MGSRDVDIKRLLQESSCLSELESRLAEMGLEFGSPKELRKFLYGKREEANGAAIREIRAMPLQELGELPYTEVKAGGTAYRLHGIVHGQLEFGCRISRQAKRFVRQRLESWCKSLDEDYLCEEGFVEAFGLDRSHEMNCIETACDKISHAGLTEVEAQPNLSIPILPIREANGKFSYCDA